MNRPMIASAVIAAGMHAAVLAFKPSPLPAALATPEPELPAWQRIEVTPIVEDPVEIVRTNDPTIDKPLVRTPDAPRGYEPVPVDLGNTSRITMEVRPAPFRPGENTSLIPNGPGTYADIGDGAIDFGLLDNSPRALMRTSPRPPHGFNDQPARVTVEFVVGRDGTVQSARVTSSTHAVLEEPCLREVRRWRFEPGTRKAVPVAFRMSQEFVFNLRD